MKKEFLENNSMIFEGKNEEELYSKIGKLQIEVDFLRKAFF